MRFVTRKPKIVKAAAATTATEGQNVESNGGTNVAGNGDEEGRVDVRAELRELWLCHPWSCST